jgi:FMN-dependent NADH-azoreductase
VSASARARTRFFTESGPVGLLTGKKAYVITTRGGVYGSGTLDTETPYLRSFLGFLGIDDVSFVHAEGLALDEATRRRSLAQAAETVRALLAEAALAA